MGKQIETTLWEVVWTSPVWYKPENSIYKYFQTEEQAKTFCDMNRMKYESITRVTLHANLKHENAVIERRVGNPTIGYSCSYMKLLPDGEGIYDSEKGWHKISDEWSELGKSLYEILGSNAVSPLVFKSVLLFCPSKKSNAADYTYQAYVASEEAIEYIKNDDNLHCPNSTIYKAEYYPRYGRQKDVIVLSKLGHHQGEKIYKRLKKGDWMEFSSSTKLKYYFGYVSDWITNEILEEFWAAFAGEVSCYLIDDGCAFPYYFPDIMDIPKNSPLARRIFRN